MTAHTGESQYEALWPGGPSAVPVVSPAPRFESLDGKRIGFLWDQMYRGDEAFPFIEERLRSTFPNAEFVPHDAFGPTFGGQEEAVLEALPARLRELRIDAVISGNGC